MSDDARAENEAKKEYLRRYGAALRAEEAIEEEIQRLRLGKLLPAAAPDGMPHGSGGCTDLSGYAARLDELAAELKSQMEERCALRREIVQKIERMGDETQKLVLRLRYVHGMRFDEIADTVGYTYRHTTRLHGAALAQFKMS